MPLRNLSALAVSAVVAFTSQTGLASDREDVRLVLQITVDQLRGDTITRFESNFAEGGFRYFLDEGIHYSNARYLHANTETAPGHASLATGAYPAGHGIVANDWINAITGEFVYNTEDSRHSYVGKPPKEHQGVSPLHLEASTIGDEIVIHNAGRSRAFSVSPKDRGAILPGGHAGKAFWFDKSNGHFTSSTFYYGQHPDWVQAWNANKPADRYQGQNWELLIDRSKYIARAIDDRPYEGDFRQMGRTFPHFLGALSDRYFYVGLYISPMADELALDFTEALIDAEKPGQGEVVDYLAVSFSAPDIAGHVYGASSLEYEDAVLRTDRNIEKLLNKIDETVGLERTLVVLSADHGGPEVPEYAASKGISAGRHPLDWIRSGNNPVFPALKEKYGRDDLLTGHSHPYVYLDNAAIEEAGLELAEVEAFVASEFMKQPGIAAAITRSDILADSLPDAPIVQKVRRSFHPVRSGNIHLIQKQYWLMHSTEEAEQLGIEKMAAIHGSPWRYDTFVPVLVAGPGVPNMKVSRLVTPYDLAPTIANYLGVKQPSASIGDVLHEVVDDD